MRNLRLTLAYEGTCYHGWQRQDNALTVQEVFEAAVERLTGEQVSVNGCSRTDAGVHAREYVLSMGLENPIPCEGLMRGLNSQLPDDIAVLGACEAEEGFHARFSCKGKEYEYLIHNSRVKDPFLKDRAYRYSLPIDEGQLDRAAQVFVGRHDFRSMCSADCKKKDTHRTIYSFHVTRNGDMVSFRVAGDGFLYNMVRILVGTLLYVGEGKIGEAQLPGLLEARDRTLGGVTVPAGGLYLDRVFYEDTVGGEIINKKSGYPFNTPR